MDDSEPQKWETLSSKVILDTPYLRVRQDCVRLPDGTVHDDFYVREARGWVAVFCLTTDGQVVLNRQYKHGIGEVVLELPTGGIDEGEAPEAAARRELEEETGYQVESMEFIGKLVSDPTSSNLQAWVYLARGGRPTGVKDSDSREVIQVELATPEELLAKIRSGEVDVQGQVAAIYMVCDRLGLLGGGRNEDRPR